MKIILNESYHIFNQGNNQTRTFYDEEDYRRFLELTKKNIYPYCKILAYCLMPNHFHFLIYINEESLKSKQIGPLTSSHLANGFRLLQSQYAQYFNKKFKRSRSLFRQKLKSKSMIEGDKDYSFSVFRYIHQNPFVARLCTKIEDWPFSSFQEYIGNYTFNLCDKELAFKLIGFDKSNFIKETYEI